MEMRESAGKKRKGKKKAATALEGIKTNGALGCGMCGRAAIRHTYCSIICCLKATFRSSL